MNDHPTPSALRHGFTRRKVLLLPLTALSLAAVASCATHPPEPTSAPVPPTPETSVEPSPAPNEVAPQLAFVVSVSKKSPFEIELDPVEILFGDEAIARAKQDKSPVLEKDEDGNDFIPNDYYIPDPDPADRVKHPLTDDGVILVIPPDGGVEATQNVSPDKLRKLLPLRPHLMQVTMDSSGSQIAELKEYYLP